MTAVNAKDIPVEQAIFTAAWNLLKEFHDIDFNNRAEWEELLKRSHELCDIGKDAPGTESLSKAFALSIFDYLEIVSKNKPSFTDRLDAITNVYREGD